MAKQSVVYLANLQRYEREASPPLRGGGPSREPVLSPASSLTDSEAVMCTELGWMWRSGELEGGSDMGGYGVRGCQSAVYFTFHGDIVKDMKVGAGLD
ncbi:hypothetical protein PSPO01_14614 [Paraphaeosphaeria sporulosa]